MATSKYCPVCKESKPATEFHRHPRTADRLQPKCKACTSAYDKQRRLEKGDKLLRAQQAAWWAEHGDEANARRREEYRKDPVGFSEKNKRWMREHPEYMQSYLRDYYQKDLEANRAIRRQYRGNNLERERERGRQHYQDNKDYYVRNAANRRAREAEAEGTYTEDDLIRMMAEQEGICFYCDADITGFFHIEHFVPLKRGGSNWPENIRLSCEPCNLSKGKKLPEEFTPKVKRY